jgi:hypothetical protein
MWVSNDGIGATWRLVRKHAEWPADSVECAVQGDTLMLVTAIQDLATVWQLPLV